MTANNPGRRLAWLSLAAMACLGATGCTSSTCVCTCQAESFTYTVFIGEVCARNLDEAADYSADIGPCQPGDELIQTDCDPSENACLFPGVQLLPEEAE